MIVNGLKYIYIFVSPMSSNLLFTKYSVLNSFIHGLSKRFYSVNEAFYRMYVPLDFSFVTFPVFDEVRSLRERK